MPVECQLKRRLIVSETRCDLGSCDCTLHCPLNLGALTVFVLSELWIWFRTCCCCCCWLMMMMIVIMINNAKIHSNHAADDTDAEDVDRHDDGQVRELRDRNSTFLRDLKHNVKSVIRCARTPKLMIRTSPDAEIGASSARDEE
eukprot:1765981-Rhodomonas_salina.5